MSRPVLYGGIGDAKGSVPASAASRARARGFGVKPGEGFGVTGKGNEGLPRAYRRLDYRRFARDDDDRHVR